MAKLKNSWKFKIDPAFGKIVREYVGFLGELGAEHREGQFSLPEDLTESMATKLPAPTLDDADLESSRDLLSYIEKSGGLTRKDLNIFFGLIESIEKEDLEGVINICAKIAKSLPEEESRQFYNKKLDSFKGDPELKKAFLDFNKDSMDFSSIVLSLQARHFFTNLFEKEKKGINANIEYLKKSNALMSIMSVLSSSLCQLAHQASLADLKKDILKGDDKAIFKAITIDKSLLSTDEIKDRINKAQLSGDKKFLESLGDAIASTPLKTPRQHGKTYAAIRMFWPHGLYKLTYKELHSFLESCDLIHQIIQQVPFKNS